MLDNYALFEWVPGVPILDDLLPINRNLQETNDDTNVNDDNIAGAIADENEIDRKNFMLLEDNNMDEHIFVSDNEKDK